MRRRAFLAATPAVAVAAQYVPAEATQYSLDAYVSSGFYAMTGPIPALTEQMILAAVRQIRFGAEKPTSVLVASRKDTLIG